MIAESYCLRPVSIPCSPEQPRPRSRSSSGCSTTCPASTPTSPARARSSPPAWRSRTSRRPTRASRPRSSRPTTRTSPTLAPDRSPMVRPGGGRSHRRRPDFFGGAGRGRDHRRKEQGADGFGRRPSDLTGASAPRTLCTGRMIPGRSPMAPASAMAKRGGDTWFFLTADYAFGAALERDTTEAVHKAGGKVLGSVKHPLSASDFSSFLLQAQGSKAKVIGAGQCRQGHHQRYQAGHRVRHRRAASPCRASGVLERRPSARAQGGPGPRAHRTSTGT